MGVDSSWGLRVNTKANKTVLEAILDWSGERPLWQRDALRRIVIGGTPDDAAVTDVLALCKKEHGAAGITLEAAMLEAAHLPAAPVGGEVASVNEVDFRGGIGAAIGQAACGGRVMVSSISVGVRPAMPSTCM